MLNLSKSFLILVFLTREAGRVLSSFCFLSRFCLAIGGPLHDDRAIGGSQRPTHTARFSRYDYSPRPLKSKLLPSLTRGLHLLSGYYFEARGSYIAQRSRLLYYCTKPFRLYPPSATHTWVTCTLHFCLLR